jgi:two-component system response regulator YesN
VLRVLIVEDEPGICALIKSLIEWNDLELEYVGYATDGLKAFERISELHPDIVISDISMPKMNGLEMIRKTREIGLNTKFIIVSGYSHFEYAQQAIRYNVDSYLLKPINQTELNNSLKRILSTLRVQQDMQKFNRLKIRQSLLNDLFWDNISVSKSIEDINKEYQFNFKKGCFAVGQVYLDMKIESEAKNSNMYTSSIISCLSDALTPYLYDFEIAEQNSCLVFIVNFCKSDTNAIMCAYANTIKNMNFHGIIGDELAVTLGIGKLIENISNLPMSCKTAKDAIKSRIILGTDRVICADNFDYKEQLQKQPFTDEESKTLSSILDTCHAKALDDFVRNQVAQDLSYAACCPYKLFEALSETIHRILAEMYVHNLTSQNISSDVTSIISKLEKCYSKELLVDAVCTYITAFLTTDTGNDMVENTMVIKTALSYINNHYSEQIRLQDVSNAVYLSHHYFGKFFKNKLGISFSDYLTNLRIDKAKGMLKDIKYNISEISNKVGYNDSKYFCRIFKTQVGVTPKEYRKLHHRRY